MNRGEAQEIVASIRHLAPDCYIRLPYHNFDHHILEVVDEAIRLAALLEEKNVDCDIDAVLAALLLHDAYYHEDHLANGYESKEDWSATAARTILEGLGAEEEFIERVCSCIMATKVDVLPQSNEEKLVRLCDVSNVYHDPDVFLSHTVSFIQERVVRGTPLKATFGEQCDADANFLDLYFADSFEFIDREGNSVDLGVQEKAQANIRLLRSVGRIGLSELESYVPGASEKMPETWLAVAA